MNKVVIAVILMLQLSVAAYAQKKIVVVGSSTAAGSAAYPYDSSWVGRMQSFFRKNTSPGDPDTSVVNIAIGGFITYHAMPYPSPLYTPPYNYPPPDPDHNITKALNENPDIVIVNLPTNDVAWG